MPWPVPNRPPCSTASSTPPPPSPAVAAGAASTSRPTGPGLVTSRRSSSACSRYPSRPETRTTRRTDSTTPARRTAPTEATLGPAGTPRPENPTPRQPTIHTHQRNEDPETPRYNAADDVAFRLVGRRRHPGTVISRLNVRPTRTPVNASPTSSRTPTHDSGPPWIATPSV